MTISIGGFLSGLVIPRDNGFALGLIERLEDVVYNIFLPIVSSEAGFGVIFSN